MAKMTLKQRARKYAKDLPGSFNAAVDWLAGYQARIADERKRAKRKRARTA